MPSIPKRAESWGHTFFFMLFLNTSSKYARLNWPTSLALSGAQTRNRSAHSLRTKLCPRSPSPADGTYKVQPLGNVLIVRRVCA